MSNDTTVSRFWPPFPEVIRDELLTDLARAAVMPGCTRKLGWFGTREMAGVSIAVIPGIKAFGPGAASRKASVGDAAPKLCDCSGLLTERRAQRA